MGEVSPRGAGLSILSQLLLSECERTGMEWIIAFNSFPVASRGEKQGAQDAEEGPFNSFPVASEEPR